MEKEGVLEPLLLAEQPGQFDRERDSVLQELRDGKRGLLGSYARTRSLRNNKNNNNARRYNQGPTWWHRWFAGLQLRMRRFFANDVQPVALPVKAGLAAVLASLLSLLSVFSRNSSWAVVTVDIVLETNVGLTFSKGT